MFCYCLNDIHCTLLFFFKNTHTHRARAFYTRKLITTHAHINANVCDAISVCKHHSVVNVSVVVLAHVLSCYPRYIELIFIACICVDFTSTTTTMRTKYDVRASLSQSSLILPFDFYTNAYINGIYHPHTQHITQNILNVPQNSFTDLSLREIR